MHPDNPDRAESRHGADVRPRPRDEEGTDPARRVTLTVALVVTFLFLLVTIAGVGWFLSDGGPFSDSGSAASGVDGEDRVPGETGGGDADVPSGEDSPPPEGTVEDPASGLTYRLPGEGWQRLGDNKVPQEYSSYTVYGSEDDPDAIIVTGNEDLDTAEPMSVAGVRLAVEALGGLVSDPGALQVDPSGSTDVDGSPAFGAAVDGGGDEGSYGRFLLVEMGESNGGFMLGINTGGGEEASAAIDEAFESVGRL